MTATANTAEQERPGITWRPHPLVDRIEGGRYRPLTADQMGDIAQHKGRDAAKLYWKRRQLKIEAAEKDPLEHGFELPHWPVVRWMFMHREVLLVFGGNDSAKTELACKLACEVLAGKLKWPGMMEGPPKVLCVAQDDTTSKEFQQVGIYKYLPVYARQHNDAAVRKRNAWFKVNYSRDGGFSNGTFTLPRPKGAHCLFRNVSQYEREKLGFEGMSFHLVIIDESCPIGLMDTLLFRAAKVGGKVLYSFTSVDGFNQICKRALTGAITVKSLPMQWDWGYSQAKIGSQNAEGHGMMDPREILETPDMVNRELAFPEIDMDREYVKGCGPGRMPFIMQPLDQNWGVVFTWGHWNPFPPRAKVNPHLTKIADRCVGRGYRTSLVRLFGYTEDSAHCQVPSFNPAYWPKGNVIRHEDAVKMMQERPFTLYCADDPATARSHFILWKIVFPPELDDRSLRIIVAECPTTTEGEWVNADGDVGDGQKVFAEMGVDDWKRYIRLRESGLIAGTKVQGDCSIRYKGDPRAFATKQMGNEGGTTYFELFHRDDSLKDPLLGPIFFEPAKCRQTIGRDLQALQDVNKLVDSFACNWDKELTAENRPHLLVSDACRNLILCILNWDGTSKSPYKDGVDAARYLCDEETPYVELTETVGGGGGGGWMRR